MTEDRRRGVGGGENLLGGWERRGFGEEQRKRRETAARNISGRAEETVAVRGRWLLRRFTRGVCVGDGPMNMSMTKISLGLSQSWLIVIPRRGRKFYYPIYWFIFLDRFFYDQRNKHEDEIVKR